MYIQRFLRRNSLQKLYFFQNIAIIEIRDCFEWNVSLFGKKRI